MSSALELRSVGLLGHKCPGTTRNDGPTIIMIHPNQQMSRSRKKNNLLPLSVNTLTGGSPTRIGETSLSTIAHCSLQMHI